MGYRVVVAWPAEAEQWARDKGLWEPLAWGPAPEEAPAIARISPPQPAAGALVMTAPDNGAVYRIDPALPRDAQRISIVAGSGAPLREVTLFVDGRPLASFDAPPYRLLWRLEPGVHTFRAEGLGPGGEAVASDEVRIDVRQP